MTSLDNATKPAAGLWRIEKWSGGFYLTRTGYDGKQEWMRSSQNPAKARRFETEERARAAIARSATA